MTTKPLAGGAAWTFGSGTVGETAVTYMVRAISPGTFVLPASEVSDMYDPRWVARTDQERNAFVHSHFHKDPTDPHEYDLVLNSSRLSVDECADCVVAALRLLQARVRHAARA